VINYDMQSMVDDVRCRCRFSLLAAEDGGWTEDADGCAHIMALPDVAAHEAACGFELLTCANTSRQARLQCAVASSRF
jgi:hypothetical protein